MRIEDIVNITDAELTNEGYITEILGFSNKLDVKRGYLFASNDIAQIKEAVQKGAYAILYSKNLEIIDDEIAWIRVEDLNEAFLKLLKYKLIDKTLYFTDEITLQIIKSINKDKQLAILESSDFSFLNENFVYLTSLERIKNIALNKKEVLKNCNLEITNSSAFLIEFFYNTKHSLIFPKLYLDNLEKGISFFEEVELNFNLKDAKIDRLYPQFINSRYEKVAFGKTQRVVIQGIKKDKFFINELNYIFKHLKYGNVKFYDKTNKEKFYKDDFDFAVLIDVEVELKEKQIKEKSLF